MYKNILDDASEELLSRIKIAPQGNLLSLLQASFPFIGVEELKRSVDYSRKVESSARELFEANIEGFEHF